MPRVVTRVEIWGEVAGWDVGSQNHGLLVLGRDLKGHIVPPPAMVLPRSPQKADPRRKGK